MLNNENQVLGAILIICILSTVNWHLYLAAYWLYLNFYILMHIMTDKLTLLRCKKILTLQVSWGLFRPQMTQWHHYKKYVTIIKIIGKCIQPIKQISAVKVLWGCKRPHNTLIRLNHQPFQKRWWELTVVHEQYDFGHVFIFHGNYAPI